MIHSDLADLAALLRHAGQTEVMPRFRRLAVGDVRAKSGPLDLVTEADEAAERVIEAGLRRRFPGCVVVGEEAASADPSLLGHIADAALAFVVDPVDGTANFAAGLPLFAVMAAAVMHGEVVGSVIHDPVSDDTACALRGEGAWLEDPGGRRSDLLVAAAGAPAAMAGTVSWRFMPEALRDRVLRNLPRLGGVWEYRCAAHQYRMLAAGHCHFAVYNRLLPWDHAPGWLLHREAGGYSARLDGSAYSAGRTDGGLICAPDRDSWRALREVLMEG